MKSVIFGAVTVLLSTATHAATLSSDGAYACPYSTKIPVPARVTYETAIDVHGELVKRYEDAMGPKAKDIGDPEVMARVSAARIDDRKMAALAEVSGCAALIDVHSSCAGYFDPELGDPLSVFMSMKKKSVLRRQFEDAIAHLDRADYRQAAQACIKLVGVK